MSTTTLSIPTKVVEIISEKLLGIEKQREYKDASCYPCIASASDKNIFVYEMVSWFGKVRRKNVSKW